MLGINNKVSQVYFNHHKKALNSNQKMNSKSFQIPMALRTAQLN